MYNVVRPPRLGRRFSHATAGVERFRSLGQGRYILVRCVMYDARLLQTAVCYSSSPEYTPSHSPEVLLECTLPHVCTVRLLECFAQGYLFSHQ